MADAKPDVVITRLTGLLGTKFQRLFLCFQGRPTRWNSLRPAIHYPRMRNQDGGCETGCNYNSAYMPLRNEISTVIPMFSETINTMESPPTCNSLPSYE